MNADIKPPDAVTYLWSPKPHAEHRGHSVCWSANTGPHPDWDVTEYCTREHAQAALDAAVAAAVAEFEALRAALLNCARQAEALKRDCSPDPESGQAVRNAKYQAISTTAHIALGTVRGPTP